MAGFLYFAEGTQGVLRHADVVTLGLGYAFDKAPSCAECAGPASRGVLFADISRVGAPPIGYSATKQQWRKIPGDSEHPVWVGMLLDDTPVPGVLQRLQMLPGHDVTLADGHTWTIPVARRYVNTGLDIAWVPGLPRQTEYTEQGEFVEGAVQRKYAHLWDVAEAFTAYVSKSLQDGEGEATLAIQEFYHDAVQAIQANYFVGPAELSLMGALSFDGAQDVLLSLIDWPTFSDLVAKKKHSDTTSSGNGKEGSPQDTPQQSAT